MHKQKGSSFAFLLQIICILIASSNQSADAGASSTPKNLVNLYTPNETLNLTSSNQFQNEYQFRQGVSKSNTPDRHKSSSPSLPDSMLDHASTDWSLPSTLDYVYPDSHAMTNVPECKGRLRLNGTRGYITDGPGHYQTNLQCSWIIDGGRKNATIRIQIHQFNTECNYDYLYIFDGDSIYSPLVAALSGDMKDFSFAFTQVQLEEMISRNSNRKQAKVDGAKDRDLELRTPVITRPSASESRPLELKTSSGQAFIYFHSDTAQSMSGFYMTYSIDSCPLDCSNRGVCDNVNLICICNQGYSGDGCQYVNCPNNCTSPNQGHCVEGICICSDSFNGPDCSKSRSQETWDRLYDTETIVLPRAFHQACIVGDFMWVLGGKSTSLSNTKIGMVRQVRTPMIHSFDINKRHWNKNIIYGLTGHDHLAELSGHSLAIQGDKIFIYGGLAMNNSVLSALTIFDTRSQTATTYRSDMNHWNNELVAPLATVGHSANIVGKYMYVFLGYNPVFGYLNFAQKYDIANKIWSIIGRKGSSISGYIGHSSTYDESNHLIYIFGGHNAFRSHKLYSFDLSDEKWTLLQSSPSPRYYHSAIILDNKLIVIGGNSYNTSHHSDQCFQQNFMTYDLSCSKRKTQDLEDRTLNTTNCSRGCWNLIPDSDGVLKRHGHSAVISRQREVILFGGFNGLLMNDIYMLNIPACSAYNNSDDCDRSKLTGCSWSPDTSNCVHASQKSSSRVDGDGCSKGELKSLHNACEVRESCMDCLSTSLGCVWCKSSLVFPCQYERCKSNKHTIIDSDMCYKDDTWEESVSLNNSDSNSNGSLNGYDEESETDCKVDNCHLCESKSYCAWRFDSCAYNPSNSSNQTSESAGLQDVKDESASRIPSSFTLQDSMRSNSNVSILPSPDHPIRSDSLCTYPCHQRQSCTACTSTKCIWCSTTEQCIDSSAYFAYHQMGQCMHYVAHWLKCPSASCSEIESCDKCLANPKCGWLNDISNTGKGRCIEGTREGPSFSNESSNSANELNSTIASPSSGLPNWHYSNCPSCQCNGHTFCKANSSICMQPCQDNTEGSHCDRCIQGYFGDPINGGSCQPCRCSGHATSCNRETGKCYCSTKGIVGHNCNKCDDKNYYLGDPTDPANGTCYYNLTTDYQYTFNMSKPEDHFYSDINFINVPLRKDSDVDFSIACSRLALVNVSSGTSFKNRKIIHYGLECGSFRLRFSPGSYIFSDANYSIFVHVYKFQTPFILQIAFSQHKTLYLPQFFFTFSSCFLFFFALSGLAWKLKHEYDLYIRRQRQLIEFEQLASRPFSTILLELIGSHRAPNKVRPRTDPTPISFEPCFGGNVGVLSFFVQLPGRPNLAIGSGLISLNEESSTSCEDTSIPKRSAYKDRTSMKNS